MKELTLEILEQALEDWSTVFPHENTDKGFCWYFSRNFDIDFYGIYIIDETPWAKYVTVINEESQYHFHGKGSTILGRAERVTAIKGMIRELKAKQN